MGSFVSDDVGETGGVRTQVDLAVCLAIVRAGSPRWCRTHEEFESVADEVIARAAATFHSAKGRFSDRLIVRAQSRVARSLMRSRTRIERQAVIVELPDKPNMADVAASDSFACVEATETVRAFIDKLSIPQERAVATLLAQGANQAEIAQLLGIHPRTISRLVARLRPLAEQHFGLLPGQRSA